MQQLPGAALSRCLRGSTAQFTQHRCCVRPQPWARGVARSPVERASRCAGRSEAHMTVIASSGNRRFRAVGSGGGATTFPRDTFAVARAALLMICASRRQQQHARSPTAATGYRGRRDVAAAASAEGAGGEASSASHDVRDDKEFTAAVNRLLRRIVVAACVALPVLSAAYGALRGAPGACA